MTLPEETSEWDSEGIESISNESVLLNIDIGMKKTKE